MLRTQMTRARQEVTFLAEGPFPVDVYELAGQYGITVEEADLGTVDAVLMLRGNEYVAVVNSKHLPSRKRFSLAHEIGHILIAEQAPDLQFRRPSCGGSSRDPVERACDQLAVEILMPEEPFKRVADSYNWGIKGALSLSTMFSTSLDSTLRRCVELASAQMALVQWKMSSAEKPRHIAIKTQQNGLRIVGFDRRRCLTDMRSLYQAYHQDGLRKGVVPFEFLPHRSRTSTSW